MQDRYRGSGLVPWRQLDIIRRFQIVDSQIKTFETASDARKIKYLHVSKDSLIMHA